MYSFRKKVYQLSGLKKAYEFAINRGNFSYSSVVSCNIIYNISCSHVISKR